MRNCVADHIGTYYAPAQMGTDDAVRYLIDGHLQDLTATYGRDAVTACVTQVITQDPDLLTHRYTDQEIAQRRNERTASAWTISRNAFLAHQGGDITGALELLDQAERIAPRMRDWDQIRAWIRQTPTTPTTPSGPTAPSGPSESATSTTGIVAPPDETGTDTQGSTPEGDAVAPTTGLSTPQDVHEAIRAVCAIAAQFDVSVWDLEPFACAHLRLHHPDHWPHLGDPGRRRIAHSEVTFHLARLAVQEPDLLRAAAAAVKHRDDLVALVAGLTAASAEATVRGLRQVFADPSRTHRTRSGAGKAFQVFEETLQRHMAIVNNVPQEATDGQDTIAVLTAHTCPDTDGAAQIMAIHEYAPSFDASWQAEPVMDIVRILPVAACQDRATICRECVQDWGTDYIVLLAPEGTPLPDIPQD